MNDIEYVMVMHDGNKATKFMSEAYCKNLMEELAAAQSQEVCTVAHDHVETCGYCQRDALLAAAGKVTCQRCDGTGMERWNAYDGTDEGHEEQSDCPACSDLRRLMKEKERE